MYDFDEKLLKWSTVIVLIFCYLKKNIYILSSRTSSLLKLIYLLWNEIEHFTNLTEIQKTEQVTRGFTLNWQATCSTQTEKGTRPFQEDRFTHLMKEVGNSKVIVIQEDFFFCCKEPLSNGQTGAWHSWCVILDVEFMRKFVRCQLTYCRKDKTKKARVKRHIRNFPSINWDTAWTGRPPTAAYH